MSKILLLSMPSHGHMNPLLGLAAQLIKKGEEVTFFTSVEFKGAVEGIGAKFECYKEDLNLFKKRPPAPPDSSITTETQKPKPGLVGAFLNPGKFIDAILDDIKGQKFDYLICSAAYPYATVIGQILNIPVVSSYAVFATIKELMGKNTPGKGLMGLSTEVMDEFKTVRLTLIEKYKVQIPENIMDLMFAKGDLNIIYTSKYFVPHPENYDESFIFIGPPIFDKKYNVDFPFEKLKGKKVIYISLGTIFGNHSANLNQLFFDSFADTDTVVVMAAYDVDLSKYKVPNNFIIRSFVPQLELLKYATVAITHAGMNSIGDLLYHKVPFVSIPLGADQFYMANRAQDLGATIVLDVDRLTPGILTDAVEKVLTTPTYKQNIKKISDSFIEAGGYKKAVEEIFELKKLKGVTG